MLDVIKNANVELRKKDKDLLKIKEYFYGLTDIASILGLSIKPNILSKDDLKLYKNYLEAKKAKNFELSDTIRKALFDKKIL